MTPRLFSFALSAALIAAAGGVRTSSVPVNGGAWETVIVPGSFAAAHRAASLGGPVEDWRTIPLLIELSFGGPEGLRITRSLEAHAAMLRSLRTHGRAISPDWNISLAHRSSRGTDFDRLLDTLGLEFGADGRSVRFKPDPATQRKVEILAAAGLPMDTIVEQLNAGGTVSIATRDALAPLPLGAAFWERRFTTVPPSDDLLWAILASREMASLYYGLLALDGPTLRAVVAHPKLESALVEHALILPTIAPTLRIENGQVRTPGGREAAHLWQALVGKAIDNPAEFSDALLGRDEGRLAYFYATVARLPPASAEWVMGGTSGDGDSRRKAFRRLYDVFRGALGEWRPNAFSSPTTHSPADVLNSLMMTQAGTVAGPRWIEFWQRVFQSDSWPADATREVGSIDDRRVMGAAEILEAICPDACDPLRLDAVLLLQHALPDPTLADTAGLLTAARARIRYPALALAIEQMTLHDLAVYRQLGDLAARIDGLESSTRAVAEAQFQTAVAILARARALGAPVEWTADRIRSLADLPVSAAGFDGALVRWLETSLMPSVSGETLQDAAVRALSGHGWQTPGATFEWEGLRYRVDFAATERERITEARERFSSNSLSDAIGLLRLADQIPEVVAAGRLEAFETTLTETAEGLDEIREVAWTGAPSAIENLRKLHGDVMGPLRRARTTDADRMQRAARILRQAADLVAADAAIALIYATALGDPHGPLALSRDLPRRHRFWREPRSAQRWTPWLPPFERQSDGAATHIAGALLGLDAGAPRMSVRRITARRPEQEPNLNATIADGLWRAAASHAPWTMTDEVIASLDDSRSRGAEVVQGWDRGFDERILDDAGIAGPRAGWLRWSAARGAIDRDVPSLEDLVRLGREPETRAAQLSAVEGIRTDFAEPLVRVAQELRARNVPAAFAPGVLMLFTTELIDHAAVPFPTDVDAVVGLVHRIPSARFDDYVAAVAARGPAVLIEEVER